MKWRNDPYWQEALKAALALSPEHRVILTPDEFVGERPSFWPVNEAPAARKYGGGVLPLLQSPRIGRNGYLRGFSVTDGSAGSTVCMPTRYL